jgi:hypothetical protein
MGWPLGVALVEGTQLPGMMERHGGGSRGGPSGARPFNLMGLSIGWIMGLVVLVAVGIGLWAFVLIATPEGGRLVRSSTRGNLAVLIPPSSPYVGKSVP